MQTSNSSSGNNFLGAQSETCESRLRRFLMWVLLAGIIFNIISWGGGASVLILQQSGVSLDWGKTGLLPIIQLDNPNTQQTTSPDATLPPTPLDITSVGKPSETEDAPTPTPTKSVEHTPVAQPGTLSITPTP